MSEEIQTSETPVPAPVEVTEPVPVPVIEQSVATTPEQAAPAPKREPRPPGANSGGARPPRENQPRENQPPRQGAQPPRPPRENRTGAPAGGGRPERGDRPSHQGDRSDRGGGGDRGGGDRGRFEQRRPDFGFNMEIELEKLVADSLYLDNQAHIVAARMRDMDSATKSHLRRFYNAVRRACRAPETERQHEFVMLRARLAYTIARHSLRSLDSLEKLLLQVTRKNEAKGYERFKDLFEAIIAYNE